MELQTQIDELKASSKRQKIAIIALAGVAVFFAVKPHGVITCDGWRVVDKDGKVRIAASWATLPVAIKISIIAMVRAAERE